MRNLLLIALLGGGMLGPLNALGEEADHQTFASGFPRPYVYQDRGLAPKGAGFTLNREGRLPAWLSLAVQHRARYETLDRAFRLGSTGSDQVLALRTLAQATLRLHRNFSIQLELQDSRALFNDSGSVINPTLVNPSELLEANLQWRARDLYGKGSRGLLRVGRLTLDVGKRRLVARNRFRNTKNAFTGVDAIWRAGTGETVRALVTLPVNRQPAAPARLLNNDASFDEESLDRILWGLFASTPHLPLESRGEIYLFGFYEEDGPTLPTANRELYTPGWRLFRPARSASLDFEWETALQFGTSRASSAPTDTRDLDHFAHFHHVEAGYTFPLPASPRLRLAFDYASGDQDPNDGNNGSFFSLFGATVFDYGPTGIHRPFVRSNILGPGLELSMRPRESIRASVHYRAFWLASSRDFWAGASGLRDPGGASGSFLGQLIYWTGAWQATPNLFLEGGIAYRIDGDFQKTAPGSPRRGHSLYTYLSFTVAF